MIGRRKFLAFLTIIGFTKTRGASESIVALPVAMPPIPVSDAISCPEPDPSKVLQEARSLAAKGFYEEALLKHIWFHENAVRLRKSLSAVRLSFGLGYWKELGEKYPKAKAALLEIQEKNLESLEMGNGDFALFQEIAAIDRYFGEPARTVESFRTLRKFDPKLAEICYGVAEEALVSTGAYSECLDYLCDPEAKLSMSVKIREMAMSIRPMHEDLQETMDTHFTQKVSRMITILARGGRPAEAEKIREAALLTLDDESIRQAGK